MSFIELVLAVALGVIIGGAVLALAKWVYDNYYG